jgi:hypothetical protein
MELRPFFAGVLDSLHTTLEKLERSEVAADDPALLELKRRVRLLAARMEGDGLCARCAALRSEWRDAMNQELRVAGTESTSEYDLRVAEAFQRYRRARSECADCLVDPLRPPNER